MRHHSAAPPLVASILALLFALSTAHADNWTRFRGPNGSGHASDVTFPASWTDEDYAWRISLPGIGHSSPIGWEQRIFITSGNAETGAVTLQCLDTDSGKQLWDREFGGKTYPMHEFNSFASTTPTVDAERVYFAWAAGGNMHCVALTHDGKDVWEVDLGRFAGPHGFAASPVVIEQVVCLQVDHGETGEDGALVGLDAATGKVRWAVKRPAGKASYSTPCEAPGPNSRTVVISQSMTGGMQAIDVKTGEILWEFPDAFSARTVSSPLWSHDNIIGVCGGGGTGKWLVDMQIQSDRNLPVTERFKLTKQVPYVPTPLVVGQNLLFLWHDQGKVSCVDLQAENPTKLLWTERIGGACFGSPIPGGEKIYCLSMVGKAVVIAANREFALLGETELGEPTNATPAVHNGKMYLRTESSLACLPPEH